MNVTDKLLKPITETSYLTAENVRRYRCIIRYFYMQYEKINYWLNQEDVYAELKSYSEFSEYTPEQCRQDLNQLVEWKNLVHMQDTKRVKSLELFNNRQYRYQITEYTVEIERMVIKLENLNVDGASLEPGMLERLCREVEKVKFMTEEEPIKIYSWWKAVNADFISLNKDYQDYMLQLNTAKAEELMKTRAFLVFKDKLIESLRIFVKSIQTFAPIIEEHLKELKNEQLEEILSKLLEYQLSIPRLNSETVSKEEIYDKLTGRWKSLRKWFCSEDGKESEVSRIYDMTNESIRKITRYASQISEQLSGGANRKEEYKLLAEIFAKCDSIKEAHMLSSVVFGVEKPLHIKGEIIRETESINSGVFEEPPYIYELAPRIVTYREKFQRSGIRNFKEEKELLLQKELERLEYEKKLMDKYIVDNKIDFKSLPDIEQEARHIMLRLITKALQKKDSSAKTDDGRTYRITNSKEKERCILNCEDGAFEMPAFVIEFE